MPRIRNTRYYAEQTAAAFPMLDKQAVVTLCTEFMKRLHYVVQEGCDVRIDQKGPKIVPLALKIYREEFDLDEANLHALRGKGRRERERGIRERRRRIRRDLGLGLAPDLFELHPR